MEPLGNKAARLRAIGEEYSRLSKGKVEIEFADSANDTLVGADAMILVTEWTQFRHVDLDEVAGCLNQPVLFDGRNMVEPNRMEKLGWTYYGIGIPAAAGKPEPVGV